MPRDYVGINSETILDNTHESTLHQIDSKQLPVNSRSPATNLFDEIRHTTIPRPECSNNKLVMDLISNSSESPIESRSNSLIIEDNQLNIFEIDNLLNSRKSKKCIQYHLKK